MRLWPTPFRASLFLTKCSTASHWGASIAARRVATSSLSRCRNSRNPFTLRCASTNHLKNFSSGALNDTIYALSTAPGRAGIAIIRISGPASDEIYRGLCPSHPLPNPREATLRNLRDPVSKILLDSALVLYFPGPKTVTGESLLELHIHGGHATVQAVLSAIPKCHSGTIEGTIRYAEPGEFTRRAFQNNRLSLDQVEALGDLLLAETEQQRRAAVRGNSGKLGRTYEEWRNLLLYARGELEALIDFSEDQHFDESPAELMSNVTVQIKQMLESIARHELASHRGELLKKGIRVALIGPPNAGKSSLLNKIVGREASIVSREAGTTRDVVEVSLDIQGYLCTFADTAGLRTEPVELTTATSSPVIGTIEQEGIKRAKAKASEADVVIAIASLEPSDAPEGWLISYDQESLSALSDKPSLIVVNKCDVLSGGGRSMKESHWQNVSNAMKGYMLHGSPDKSLPKIVGISCMDADSQCASPDPGNIHHFITELVQVFEAMTSIPPEEADLIGVTERQRQLLAACSTQLQGFMNEANSGEEVDIVIAAEYLRGAAHCLSKITGRGEAGDVEDVLGVVFEKFCVGK